MVALGLLDSVRCSGCGGDLRETTEHDDWVADPPLQCHRCVTIAAKQRQYEKDYPDEVATMRWSARRRKTAKG